LIGLICLYSATTGGGRPFLQTGFGRQIIWLMLGAGLWSIVICIPLRFYFQGAYFVYGLSLVFLVLVLFLGRGDVHRWISLGFFRFQPSEMAKLGTLLALARYMSHETASVLSRKRLAGAFLFALFPVLLILYEPDVGTATVYVALLAGMVIWAGVTWNAVLWVTAPCVAIACGFHVLALIVFFIILGIILWKRRVSWPQTATLAALCFTLARLAPSLWTRLEPYQQQRILIFLGMKSDPHGAAYQVIQSKVAIGSGGILGKGLMQGSQTQLRFLPEQHTDFIFSVLAEEMGFIGVLLALGVFLFLLLRVIRTARLARTSFSSLATIGIFSVLAYQWAVNVGMTVGLAPVTGLPLPFLSYGGSSLLLMGSLVALTANISAERYV
jgi:rod shape determining protein RodA